MPEKSAQQPLLELRDLRVWIRSRQRGVVRAVDGVSLSLWPGETLGIVGESGSGKTITSLSIMRLEPRMARIESGQILLDGQDLARKSAREMRAYRGRQIGVVLQDPMTSLDPAYSIGSQVAEGLQLHQRLRGSTLMGRVLELLRMVRIPSPEHRVHQFPHQMSGGMRQRVTSAIALSNAPRLLIADEPTTALDVTIEAQYLDLLRDLQATTGVGIVLISHDLGVVRRMAHRVAVMYAGQLVEVAPVEELFDRPRHPYTAALLNCIPRPERPGRLEAIEGQPPDPAAFPAGCRFAPRCRFAREVCTRQNPALSDRAASHQSRCWGTATDGWIPESEFGDGQRDHGVGVPE